MIMNAEENQVLKEKILEKIEQISQEVGKLEESTKPISPENSIGRVSRMDAINNKSVAEAALRSSNRKLAKLKVALTKIGKPGFGICAMCNHPIPTARLMFMPESSRCVRCADR